ncbi:hypothetical protein BJ987_004806 [Nocardia goodfellowii]|uniref:Uncharacterized protein n=1 Tax=Nocardia goodfellowii TaxID=882446 RepID=A0ABS4QJP4_9NOCA|nr:hypothetical protein [Nocardia goodfellowii]
MTALCAISAAIADSGDNVILANDDAMDLEVQ